MSVKITMTVEEALELAINALDTEAEETYEDCEREDPEIAAWIQKRERAIGILGRQLTILKSKGL